MTALVRCAGPNGTGCSDRALVQPGRLCNSCRHHSTRSESKPKPAPKRSRRIDIETLIRVANSEVVQAERAARRVRSRR